MDFINDNSLSAHSNKLWCDFIDAYGLNPDIISRNVEPILSMLIFFSQVLEQKGGLSGSPAANKTYETVPPVDLVEEKPSFYGKMS